MGKIKHFISIADIPAPEMLDLFNMAENLKIQLKDGKANDALLKGKTLVMIFEKPSLRTRLSLGDTRFILVKTTSVWVAARVLRMWQGWFPAWEIF